MKWARLLSIIIMQYKTGWYIICFVQNGQVVLYDMYEADLNKNTFKKFSSELTDILNTVTDQLLYKEYHLHIAK